MPAVLAPVPPRSVVAAAPAVPDGTGLPPIDRTSARTRVEGAPEHPLDLHCVCVPRRGRCYLMANHSALGSVAVGTQQVTGCGQPL